LEEQGRRRPSTRKLRPQGCLELGHWRVNPFALLKEEESEIMLGHFKKRSECGSYNYLLYLPEGFQQLDKRGGWPLLLFLHGADRKGANLDVLRSSGIARLCEERLRSAGSIDDSHDAISTTTAEGEGNELEGVSTVDILIEDVDGDSPRTASAGLHMRRAAALARRSPHRRTPSVGAIGMPSMQSFPFVVVSPQCPPFKFWRVESLKSLIKEVTERYGIDRRRIYAVGEGMGGWAVCALAARMPRSLAACVPIGAAADPNYVDVNQLKETPLWIFQGCSDSTPIDEKILNDLDGDLVDEMNEASAGDGLQASLDLVRSLRKKGARSVLFTAYPTSSSPPKTTFPSKEYNDNLEEEEVFGLEEEPRDPHGGSEFLKRTYTYDNPLLYQWLLQHSLPLHDV